MTKSMVLGRMTCVGIYKASQTEICLSLSLSQTQISLSQTQLRQLACPKSIKIVTNGVPAAPSELKLGQNESYGLQEPF